jgi:ADP-heptose:LPS heptosyltransferase
MSLELLARTIAKISPKFVDRTIKALATNRGIDNVLNKVQSIRFHKVNNPQKILIVPDINIGDAVIFQFVVTHLKNSFPNMDISYIYQHRAFPLIRTNPHIHRHFPCFRSIGFPSKKDVKMLREVISQNDFDVIFNLCPYFPSHVFRRSNSVIFYPAKLVFSIARAYDSNEQEAHVAFHVRSFSEYVVEKISSHSQSVHYHSKEIPNPHLFIDSESSAKTKKLMKDLKIPPESLKVMFNPDSASKFTLIPVKLQVEILKGILAHGEIDCVLMNCGFTFDGIERQILEQIPSSLKKKIIVIPKHTEIDIYSVLTDYVDMFISGDTAPLHIAASKKICVDSDNSFQNSTAVVGIFGATNGKIYGYDSYSPGYMNSAQQAPSKVFESNPTCKNLSCMSKTFKTCQEIRCFEGLQSEQIITYVHRLISQRRQDQ